jgi:hypothetical protein
VSLDVHLDEIGDDSQPRRRTFDAFDCDLDRFWSRPHRMIEVLALDEAPDGIHQHPGRAACFTDGDLVYVHARVELI